MQVSFHISLLIFYVLSHWASFNSWFPGLDPAQVKVFRSKVSLVGFFFSGRLKMSSQGSCLPLRSRSAVGLRVSVSACSVDARYANGTRTGSQSKQRRVYRNVNVLQTVKV